jgi:hypothetical protein
MHKGGYMDERRLDEHDPRFNPDDLIPYDWPSFFAGIGRAIFLALAAAGIVSLLGCDDFDRKLAEQEFRAKVFTACVPDRSEQFLPPHERTIQSVLIRWEDDDLVFHRITVSGRYGRTFPHTEIRVETVN